MRYFGGRRSGILAVGRSRGRWNETSTNFVWYLYSFRALFVLYGAVMDNKPDYCGNMVFKKLRFRDGLVWTVSQTLELKLRF